MLNQDSWDEALLGAEKKTTTLSPKTLLPGPNISKSLVPLAGLLLALTVASGFELVGKTNFSFTAMTWPSVPAVPKISLELPVDSLISSVAVTQVSAEKLGLQTLVGLKSVGQLLADGYQSLGEVSLTVLSQTSNLVSSEITAISNFGVEGLNEGSEKVIGSSLVVNQGLNVLATVAASESKEVLNSAGTLPKAGGLMAASVLASLGEWYDAAMAKLSWWGSNTRDFLIAYGGEIGVRWRNFLGRGNNTFPAVTTPVPVSLDDETKSDIKDIKSGVAEILKKLNSSSVPVNTGLPREGMVVVPKVGSATPASLKTKVSGMFSDQVNVSLDESGKAGVITPVFRRGPGDDYLFVLTPVTP